MRERTDTTVAAPAPRRRRTAGLALLALAATDFLVVLDGLLVAVALPEIHRSLGFTQAGLGWVITAYVLVFGGFLLLGGRAADLFGRRRVLLSGFGLFAAGALAGGLAPGPGTLVFARGLQGLGAAMMAPAGLALLVATFQEEGERNRALGVWAAAGSVGIPAGALLGGFVTATLGWRWVLLINAPVALLAAALAWMSLEESRSQTARRQLDLPGAVLATTSLALLVFGITQVERVVRSHLPGSDAALAGWGGVLVPVGVAVCVLVAFVAVERRAREPLLPLRIFSLPGLVRANVAAAGLPVGLGAMMFIGTQYLQRVLGMSEMETGFGYLALALPVIAGCPVASWLVPRLGRRSTAALGFVLQAGGLVTLLAGAAGDGSLWWTVVPAFTLTGLGAPIAYIPVTAAAVDDVDDDSGIAAGLFNTTQQVANALALALMATAVAVVMTMSGGPNPDGAGTAALVDGLRAAWLLAAVLCLMAAGAALRLRGGPVPVRRG